MFIFLYSKLFMLFPCSSHMACALPNRDLFWPLMTFHIKSEHWCWVLHQTELGIFFLKGFQLSPASSYPVRPHISFLPFLKCQESSLKFYKQGNSFSIRRYPCLASARGCLVRQVNAGLFKQNKGLSCFLGSLLPVVQSLLLPTREMTFRMGLL